jgi:hypothetical protein
VKRYVNCYPSGYLGIYELAENARTQGEPGAYAYAVEIELPDPPHEWKVGDWFTPGARHTWDTPTRICDISHGMWSGISRSSEGDPRALDGWTLESLNRYDATPCDPPDWWTE